MADLDVLIIGGGFSGTMVATHLLRRRQGLLIGVLERKSQPGRGLAYSSPHRFHLLNVPAAKMSALPEDPGHFLRWAQSNHDASVQPRSFLPRNLYGNYVGSLLEQAIADGNQEHFRWIQDEALSLQRRHGHWAVQGKSGTEITARAVALALGNFPPADPRMPGLNPGSTLYFPFAWASKVLEDLPAHGSILLIGSGLTSVDLVMALRSKKFKGTVHVLSRKGLLPRRSRPAEPWPLFWDEHAPRTTRGLLRMVREQIELAEERDVTWRGVIDSLRPVTQKIWQSLPRDEQRRFLRHLRSHWEVHRHRIAPEIGDVLADMKAEGIVHTYAGRIIRYSEKAGIAKVSYRERQSRRKKTVKANRVVNCTGSETDCRRIDDSLIVSLFAQGLARPDPLFLGLDTDRHGGLIDYNGAASTTLLAVGPTRKGSLWETTAVPEIRKQAADVAEYVGSTLASHNLQSRDVLGTAV
ncbi:MAG: FAD/NAD(P)-binding protein [Acidobacteria bacterium]|nr:FAD/NAD(P)-binding protein [Acidobacteriota bacterium]